MSDPRNEELLRDLDRLVEEVNRLKEESHESPAKLAKFKAEVDARLERLRDKVGNAARDARAELERRAKATDEYVQEHPWESAGVGVAIGAGLGFLLGMLVSRR